MKSYKIGGGKSLGFFLLSILLLILSGCSGENTTSQSEYIKQEQEIVKSVEPSSFRKYALVGSGSLQIEGTLTTQGPLADVHVNGELKARALSLDISGKITASNDFSGSVIRSFDYESTLNETFVNIRALKVSEYLNTSLLEEYYLLDSNGQAIHKIKGQDDMSLPSHILATHQDNTWIIDADDVRIDLPLIVEGDLNITSDNFVVLGTLMVQGNLFAKGSLNINTGTPFDKALIVDKNIQVEALTAIGRIHGSGSFTSTSTVNILGNAEIDGDITLYGDAKINLLDNVYKAALYDAQLDASESNTSFSLVHSQLFADLEGKNSVILFTFVEGDYIMNEDTLLYLIENNQTSDFKFHSFLYGATINYASQLQKFDGLSDYFINKQGIFSTLKAQGYEGLKISEHLDIAPSNLYLSIEDAEETKLGTYLVYALSQAFNSNKLVELNSTQRDNALYNLEHSKEIEAQEEADALVQIEAQKEHIISNDEINFTTKSQMLNEIEEAENNTSSIDKEALKEEILEDRIQEWVEYKDLAVEDSIITSAYINEDNTSTQTRGWWKRFKRAVKKVFKVITFDYCYKHYQTKSITGVDSDSVNHRTDRWYEEITVWNDKDYCTPTAIAMIINYHTVIRKRRTALYSSNINSDERDSGANPLSIKLAKKFKTKKDGGTPFYMYPTQVPYYTYKEIKTRKMKGYAWTYYTAFWNRAWQHYLIKYYINRNNPVMFNAMGGTRVNGHGIIEENHSMPVIGYKRQYYTGWCRKRIMPEKKWILVDTEYHTRGYIRFDMTANYFRAGSITYVRVY